MIAVFPNLLVIGAYFVGWIPESLSWLICKNQMDKARTALVNVAKINQKDLEVCYKIVTYKKMSYPYYCVSYLSIYLDIGVILFYVGKDGVDRKNNARYAS